MSGTQKSELVMGRKVAEALAKGGQVAGKRIAGLAEDDTYFVVEIVGATAQGVDARVIHTSLTREVADAILVLSALRDAGWYPGRTVDVTPWVEAFLAHDKAPIDSAIEILREFGGLQITPPRLVPGAVYSTEPFGFDPQPNNEPPIHHDARTIPRGSGCWARRCIRSVVSTPILCW